MKKLMFSALLVSSFVFLSKQGHAENNRFNLSGNDNKAKFAAQPASDVITINNNEGAHGIARIYLQSGKKISETFLMPGSNKIDVSKLPHGDYIVSVMKEGGKTYNQKFTK